MIETLLKNQSVVGFIRISDVPDLINEKIFLVDKIKNKNQFVLMTPWHGVNLDKETMYLEEIF